MRSWAGVLAGKLVFVTICCFPVPIAFAVAYTAWREGEDWAWIALVSGLAGAALIVGVAVKAARGDLPRITRGDLAGAAPLPHRDDTFVLWAPRSGAGPADAELVRADVLEAALVRYSPEGEATFTTCTGDHTPDEFTPLIRLRLRVHGPAGPFKTTGEWRVPSVCLSAVTAGRLAVLAARTGGDVVPQWPRSTLLAGTRSCRVTGLDGRTDDVTGRPVRLLRQMRIARAAGGVELEGDTIDLRRLDADTAARYTALAERDRASPEARAPVAEPGEASRWIVDRLPGEKGAFGTVGRRWWRRGGVLVRGRFLEMRCTDTFQDHGPVLDTVLRVQPADGGPPFDAARRLTVPLNYLAVLHRTRDVVLYAAPDGGSYIVDWARTCLLAGTGAATVVAPDGRQLAVTERPGVLWALMNLLASHGVSVPGPVLDLRGHGMNAVAEKVLDVLRGGGPP
ncbi:hypothetical protein [Streptomyces sp. NPDC049881]|uniref:hypothetical protein n=1 Tax=Streptomyces sp. NPDC049881 TaxID=3155778 RepID=UPI003449D928